MDLALSDTNEITGATQIRSNTNLFLVNPIVYDFRFLDPIGYCPNSIQNLNSNAQCHYFFYPEPHLPLLSSMEMTMIVEDSWK